LIRGWALFSFVGVFKNINKQINLIKSIENIGVHQKRIPTGSDNGNMHSR
jgi:hypothetical protein